MPESLFKPRSLFALFPLLFWSAAHAELRVAGVGDRLADNVRLFSALADEPCDAPAWRVRRRYARLANDTARALEPFGFYSPDISTSLTTDDECWQAVVEIDPGSPTLWRNVDFRLNGEAESDPSVDDLKDSVASLPGKPLDHEAYETYKRNLQIIAADRGYVDMTFTEAKIDVWPDDLAADLTLHVDSGMRYAFGDIDVTQSVLDPELVSGYIAIDAGTPFDRRTLQRAQRDLSDSGYFGRVQLTANYEVAENGRIPVSAVLEPGTRIEYTVGAGASTDTGPRFRAGFRNNRINSRGHRLRTDLNVSTLLQGLSAEYRMPLGDPRSEWRSFTGAVSHEQTDTFETDTVNLGFRRSHLLRSSWIRTTGFDVTYDQFEVAAEQQDTLLLVPSLTFDQKLADADLYPSRGRRLTFEINGTSESIGSSTTYLQLTAQARWVRALGDRTRILARSILGYTETDDFDRLPPSVRFFAGGDESIRGYDLDSLGTLDADGEVVGGTRLVVASLEIERRITGNFYGAVFADAGNAFSDEEFDPVVGAGLGIKWRSPVGPVRLYVGFPVDDDDRNPRFHLRLGADL